MPERHSEPLELVQAPPVGILHMEALQTRFIKVQLLPQAAQLASVFNVTQELPPQHVCPVPQQPVPQAGMPAAHVRQSVMAALQLLGFMQVVIVAA